MSKIKVSELSSGLRVITDRVPSVESVALGVWVGVGTRHEDMINNGVAHLVEHMLFKGTKRRSAQDIAEVIENVGGSMNAYTGREVTSYHIHLLKDDTDLALDVLADMIQHSQMPEGELEKERHVVLQEIGMCLDTPDDLVFDHYYETAYPKQALGAPILGKAPIIENMSREILFDYVSRFYTPGRMVVSAAGNIEHDEFAAKVEELFDDLPPDQHQGKIAADYQGGDHRSEKELEQSHLILGFRGLSRLDEDFYAAQALSTLLGGGMSSRLFQEVREKRGLVYSIFSFHSAYLDDGQFGIYAGTGPGDLPELIPVVCDEIRKIADTLSTEELERTRAQLRASLLMGRESMMSRADQQAKYLLFRDQKLDVKKLIAQIDTLDGAVIARTAQRVFSSTPTVAALGPLEKLEPYAKISKRLAA